MWQRLKLLKRLQEVDVTSLDEGLELLERIKTNTGSVEDRGRFVHLMRVTLEVTEAIRSAPEGACTPRLPTAVAQATDQAQASVGQGRPAPSAALTTRPLRTPS